LRCSAAFLLLPTAGFAQRSGDPAYIEARLTGLQRQLAGLSARIKELKIQDQQLQERLDAMRTDFEARLGRQENGARGQRAVKDSR
jgi:TolA-binding protein